MAKTEAVKEETGKTKKAEAGAEPEVLAKISAEKEPYREMGLRLHELITSAAPDLKPRLWYGMPAYTKGGKVICFFRAPWANEKHEYMTFGITENANLSREPGAAHQLLPSAWYFTELDEATATRLTEIVRSAAG